MKMYSGSGEMREQHVNLSFSLVFTFCIWIPVFAILQVHVDICTQLWSAGVEHTKDFVLVKSSFLKKKKKKQHMNFPSFKCRLHATPTVCN